VISQNSGENGYGFLHQLNLNQTGSNQVPVPDSKHIAEKFRKELT